MKKVYFEISNGEIIRPYTVIPRYYAVIDYKLKVIDIKTCFSQQNIDDRGQDWVTNQIEEEKKDWLNYKHLMKNLKKYLLLNFFHNNKIDYEKDLYPRFVYLSFWN